MKIKYKVSNLPFRYPFTISRGTKTHQPALLIEIEHFGFRGYGEAPAISYYAVTIEKLVEALDDKQSIIEKFAFTHPERFWHYLHHLIPGNSFLTCALDMAGWDLYGKMQKQQLYKLWKLKPEKKPLTDYTIGIDTIENMVEKIKNKPWPIYKIKLGTEDDIGIMKALHECTSSLFRIDANAAWTAGEALEKINIFKNLNVELIEQPLDKSDWEGMKYLFEHSPLPLIADESCVAESDVEKCAGYFHGINIKLTKCGGISPALRMIKKARELDMKVMGGSMNESSIGTGAIAQLLPELDYVDMDGPLLLKENFGEGVRLEAGEVIYTDLPGLGVNVQPF
ncbi:dipeptide epimerase [soil metagenome]